MNAQIIEAIANADVYLNNVCLPNYSELIAAAKLALKAIDSRISAEDCTVRDEDREAYEALCKVLVAEVCDE